jgi:trimethylamine:corrinoid methyltransferase-like protein
MRTHGRAHVPARHGGVLEPVSYTACAARYARRFGLPYGPEGGRCSALPVAWIAAATGAGLCFTEGGVSEELVVR